MNAIVKTDSESDATKLLQVISAAASNKDVDVSKIEQLYGIYSKIRATDAEMQFNDSLNAAQAEMGRIEADKDNNQTHSKYASYAAIDREIRPIYSKHGFAMSFGTGQSQIAEHALVYCDVSHRAGHTKRYEVNVPVDGKGAKGGDVMTKVHAFGAGIQYGMRYLAKAIWNLAIGSDEDDDGNSGEPLPNLWKSQESRKHYSTEIQRAWGRNDAPGLVQLWEELDTDQKANIWRDFNSVQRREINEMIVSQRKPRAAE